MAEPTPPLPTTGALAPATARPLRFLLRTKPAPSNMSPRSEPSDMGDDFGVSVDHGVVFSDCRKNFFF